MLLCIALLVRWLVRSRSMFRMSPPGSLPHAHAGSVKAEVLKTKLEVSLLKAQPGLNWRSLEKGAAGPAAAGVAAAAAAAPEQGPSRAYPSSKPTRNWDKVEGGCWASSSALCFT